MLEALWCFPVQNVSPYMRYLPYFVSRPLVKASDDWFAYSAGHSAVVRNNSAEFVVLISFDASTCLVSRVLHLATGQETSASRTFLRDRLRERVLICWKLFQAFEICLPFKSRCFLTASLAEKSVVEQSTCCCFILNNRKIDIQSCEIDNYYAVMIIELKVLALLPKWHGVLRT